jgi:Heavy-metal resistance
MKKQLLRVLLPVALTVLGAQNLSAMEQPNLPAHEQLAQSWEDYGREFRGWFGRWWDQLTSGRTRGERPLISIMLRNREKLGLSDDQVRRMEQLRTNYEKESIRRDADIRVAEMDLDALVDAPSVDMVKVEAKVREIEKLHGDLRLARIRAIEKGKELLTPDQRKKLRELLTEPDVSISPRPERRG